MDVSRFSPRGRVHHRDCSFSADDPARGRAQQQFKESSNINVLIAKYRKLGVWPSGAPGVYDDEVTWPKNLGEAFEVTARAAEQFAALPAVVRRKLGNDPRRLLELDEDDLADMRKYLLQQEAQPPVDEGSGGSRPPGKEAKPPKKPEAKPKVEEPDQE